MHSINEERKNIKKLIIHFGVKINFQEFSNFSESFGLILLAPLTFLKLLKLTSCTSYLEIFSNSTDYHEFGKVYNFQC